MKQTLKAFQKNGFALKNHVVMAPMTRSRAINNIPNDLMAQYYQQRSGAGLIITEGTAPTPEGLGYARIPGIFNTAQIEGWKKTTAAVHAEQSKIFLQLMHTGRIGHIDNLPTGAVLIGPSNIKAAGQIFTDTALLQDHSEPQALSTEGIKSVIAGFVSAAKNAITAGFDGIELHGANGYLIEQFLNPHVNNRTDEYGGSIANRARFVLELVEQVAAAIGKEKVGIRFSPYSTFNDMAAYDPSELHDTYAYLAKELDKIGIIYLHISVNPELSQKTFATIRANFNNIIIQCNGLSVDSAEMVLHGGAADLVAFGRPFISNPDFVQRIEKNAPLNQPDYNTAYTPGSLGYTDYATLQEVENAA